ncbi:syntaxin-binding protein 4-like isoform X3 [Motacilla alba alba]|uniref:syntaxin-binding protein 4-like isoform X3 n=1 Tax=Motacilla alba alba TaxID=1094192 RepID=UPI0018D5133F|nr:syntaxin-binding protein 4-like isoform X3 [Motacilla alba alba]
MPSDLPLFFFPIFFPPITLTDSCQIRVAEAGQGRAGTAGKMPAVSILYKGAIIISRTLMGPYGMDRTVHCFDFYECANGLGIKVIGGIKELTGEEYGVYVKRILPGGVAYADGRLQPGDQILEVNGDSLIGVTSERAVDILRTASATSHMRLLIARDDNARREFSELLEKFGSQSNTGSARSSPVLHGGSRYLESTSSGSSSRSQSPLLLSPANSHGPFLGSLAHAPHAHYSIDSGIQSISVANSSGLGLTISGGSNRPDGPMIYVQELLPDGDCYKDGRLRPGDQLIAINRDSLVGSTHEEARKIIEKAKFRHEGSTEVAFIPGRGWLHPGLSVHNNSPSPPPKAVGNGLSSCRLKVHVRSPENRRENPFPVPSLSPDICPPELTVSAPASASNYKAASGTKPKVALDPHIRLKDGKLELVLQYLGLDATEEKKRQLRQSLTTDSQGTVAYGDVLQALRDLMQEELDKAGLDSSSVLFTQHEVANLLDTSAFHSLTFDSPTCNGSEDLEQLQLEMRDLRHEVRRLKSLLREVESSKKSMEDELQRLNQKALGFLSENRTLHSKLQMAEVVQRQAHSAEQDYEEVIHLLEAEIAELKMQLAGKKAKHISEIEEDILELKRQLSLADGQLRKSEVSRKRLEICNRKLLLFVQNIYKVLSTHSHLPDEKSVNHETEEDKTDAVSDTSLPPSDLVDLLLSEAKELLAPILSNKDALPWDRDQCLPAEGIPNYKEQSRRGLQMAMTEKHCEIPRQKETSSPACHLHQKTTWPPPAGQTKSDQPQPPSPTELPEKST